MARGWESKGVEAQIDSAHDRRHPAARPVLSLEEMERIRKRESVALSRTRIVHELETATSVRYRDLLTKTLSDLDAQLAALAAR